MALLISFPKTDKKLCASHQEEFASSILAQSIHGQYLLSAMLGLNRRWGGSKNHAGTGNEYTFGWGWMDEKHLKAHQ